MVRPLLASEEAFDVSGTNKKMRLRVYAPVPFERSTWACQVKIGPPIGRDRPSYGEGALQALVLAVNKVAIDLYSSQSWREGRLGWRGRFGGYLGVPAPAIFLDVAPFRFDLGAPEDKAAILMNAQGEPEPGLALVEETLAITDPIHPLGVRVFTPERWAASRWRCRVQIDHPMDLDCYVLGESSLEALWRGLCLLAGELYGSKLWRAGKLGHFGEPGGFLGLPPPTSLAFLTQHSF